jgi:hypothetical protein
LTLPTIETETVCSPIPFRSILFASQQTPVEAAREVEADKAVLKNAVLESKKFDKGSKKLSKFALSAAQFCNPRRLIVVR